MKRNAILGACAGFGCFLMATPAAAQPWGMGAFIPTMAQNGLFGPEVAWRARQFQAEQQLRQYQQYQQFQRFQQSRTGPPYGKAWGLRGGKPFKGKGHPLNGLPNGRAFQNPSTLQNTFGSPRGDRRGGGGSFQRRGGRGRR